MSFHEGSRVVLLRSLRLQDGAINAGTRGTVKRITRTFLIVRLDGGRVVHTTPQMLGDDPLQSSSLNSRD